MPLTDELWLSMKILLEVNYISPTLPARVLPHFIKKRWDYFELHPSILLLQESQQPIEYHNLEIEFSIYHKLSNSIQDHNVPLQQEIPKSG